MRPPRRVPVQSVRARSHGSSSSQGGVGSRQSSSSTIRSTGSGSRRSSSSTIRSTGSRPTSAHSSRPQSSRQVSNRSRSLDVNSPTDEVVAYVESEIPMHQSESERDYIHRVIQLLHNRFGSYHRIPLWGFRNAFGIPTFSKVQEKDHTFLIHLIDELRRVPFTCNESQGLNPKVVPFMSRLSYSHMFFAKPGVAVVEIQRTQAMKKDLAEITVAMWFQCEGFAIPTIDTETGDDSGLRFNKKESSDDIWWNERLDPRPALITDEMGRIMYGEYWNNVRSHNRWIFTEQTKQSEERSFKKNFNNKFRKKYGMVE